MSFLSYLWVEIKRLFRKKNTWIFLILTLCSPIAGYSLYQPAYNTAIKSNVYLGNPAMAGAFGGAVLFALFTLMELNSIYKNHTDVITDSIVSPIVLNITRVLSILGAAIITQLLTILFYLPYTIIKMGVIFELSLYIKLYLVVMFPTLVFAVLFAAAMYQITRRFDLSLLLYILFILFSINTKTEGNYILRWINPILWTLSDDFGNSRILMSIGWNRLFWFVSILGIWLVSILCIRKYKKNILDSIIVNIKKIYLPVSAVLLFLVGSLIYIKQPFVDQSAPLNSDYYNVTYSDTVFYNNVFVEIKPNVKTGKLFGNITYELVNLSGQPQDITLSVNPGYKISNVTANGAEVPYTVNETIQYNTKEFTVTLPAEQEIKLSMEYGGFPQEWNLTKQMPGRLEISSDYIFITQSAVCPVPRNFFPADPFTQADIILPDHLKVVVTGIAEAECISDNEDGTKTWRVQDSTPSMKIMAGDFISEEIVTFVSENLEPPEISIQFLYSKKHKPIMDKIQIKEVIKEVFDYCNQNIGIMGYYTTEGLKVIELTSYIAGGIAELGSSSIDEGCFSEAAFSDQNRGATGAEVVAHEIIHQWWGLSVMIEPQGENDPWSSEGLTCYTTYRLMKEKYGEDYAKTHYIDVWQKEADKLTHNFYYRNPEYLKILPEEYRNNIINAQSSILRYNVMPLKLLKAEKLVGGEKAMDEILQKLYNGENNASYPYLQYQDFLNACGLREEDLELD